MPEKPPTIIDVKEFNFKLKCKLKVFGHLKVDNPTNLLAVASKYGVIFAGTPTGVQCIKTENILNVDMDHRHSKNVTSYPRRNLQLDVQPTHLGVSADNEMLAVALVPNDCAVLFVYSVSSFGSLEIQKKNEARLSTTPGVTVSDLQWNPGTANMLAVVMTDGSAAVFEFKENSISILGSIPQHAQASCLCWSPKGKQVVIGAKNGNLTQYKPEMKAVKNYPPPQLQGVPGLSVISVHWLSNFQFIAVYRCPSDPSGRTNVMVVNVAKNMPITYINYEDVCYGSNTSRPEHYFIHQPAWNILIVGTTNSMEANVLGMNQDNWVQWVLDDGGRAELPLNDNHQDVFNIGMGLDISPTQPVMLGENVTIEPMPLLAMLSHDGVLCFFQAINTLPGAAKICQPPQPFPDSSGLNLFNLPEAGDASTIPSPPKEESKASDVRELGEQVGPKVESILPNVPSSAANATVQNPAANSSLGQGFPSLGMNLSFKTQSSGSTTLNFNQPVFSSAANQSLASPISNYSSAAYTGPGQQASAGQSNLSFGSFGLNKPTSQAFQQISFNAPNSTSQIAWPAAGMNQHTPQKASVGESATISLKQSTPVVEPNTNKAQTQLSGYTLPQSTTITLQPASAPASAENKPFLNFQLNSPASPTPRNAVSFNQMSFSSSPNQAPSNQFQPNQTNEKPQLQSPESLKSQFTPSMPEQKPSSPQPQQSPKSTPVQEVEEESEEKEMLREMNICKQLLHTFSMEMEQKKAAIKYISTQTECNIKDSKSKEKLICDLEALRKFEEELKETGVPDQTGVNALGNSVLEIFGWYEKIKAKERMAKNPGYIELIESQDLDPITKNYLNNIDKYVYYLESQIKQAKVKLGSLWDNIGSPNFEVPVMEVIYQSLVAQINVLSAKKAIVDSCEAKMKKYKKNRSLRSPRRYVGDLELSTLAERLLDTRISDTDLLQDTSIRNASNNYIMLSKRMAKKNLDESKVDFLHQWHKNHKVITTKITKKNAIVVNPDISSKDDTFSKIISPSKQSTPYIHATPKKASTSIPRKSLFTITSMTNNGSSETGEVSLTLSNLDIQQNTDDRETESTNVSSGADKLLKIKSESNVLSNSIDNVLKNNLSPASSKVIDVNKIDGLEVTNASSTTSGCGSQSGSPSISTIAADSKEAIPTPASFKEVQPQALPKEKSETIISTSWGSQPIAFGKPFFTPSSNSTNTKASTSTSPSSIFSGPANSNVLMSSSSSTPLKTVSFNLASNEGNQSFPSSSKSVVSQPTATASANSLFQFSNNQKTSVASSLSSTEKDPLESPSSTTPLYIPTAVKNTTTSPSTTTGNSSSIYSPSVVNISPDKQTTTSSTFNINSSSVSVSSSNQPTTAISSSSSLPANSIFSNSTTSGSIFGAAALYFSSTPSTSKTIPTTSSSQTLSSTSDTPAQSTTSSATSISQQTPVSSQAFNVAQFGTATSSSSTETVATAKSSASAWTGGSIFGGSISTSSAQHPSTSTTASIFGGTAVFGSLKTPVVSSAAQSVFGGSPIFASVSSAAATPVFSSLSATNNASIFSNASTTKASIFGSVNTDPSSTSAPVAVTESVSSVPASSSDVTSSPAPSSTTSITTTAASTSVFGTPATTSVPSMFASSSATSSSVSTSPSVISSSLFGATQVTTSAPAFASATAAVYPFSSTPTTTSNSIFNGTASNTSTLKKKTPFGGTPTTTASIFEAATTTAASFFGNNSVFGAASTTTSSIFGGASIKTTSSVFGTTNSTTASSVFGGASSSTPSVFGATTTTTAPSVFGATTTTTAPSVFAPASTTTSSIFGGANTSTASSVFGSPNNQGNSVFGAAAALSSTSFFGSPTTTSSASFGNQSTASIFGGSSSFTTPSTTNSFFGKTICSYTPTTASVFGGSTSNVFGTASTTSSSIFGGSSFEQKPLFSQTSGSVFGQTSSSAGNFGSSGGALFGGSSSFGSPSSQGNIFQTGGSGNIFGGAANTSPFSGGNQSAGQSTFGSPPSFQSAQRPFGTATPALGGQSSFGAAPTFGGSPSFGSPGKAFGATAAPSAQTFGSTTQQSSTFENLANQDTLSFGNLAQQQTFPTSSFGGSSFSSWR